MKTIATIIFIIFLGITAQAQTAAADVKVESIETTILTETPFDLNIQRAREVARLYKFKNALILKELNFITKADRPKMA